MTTAPHAETHIVQGTARNIATINQHTWTRSGVLQGNLPRPPQKGIERRSSSHRSGKDLYASFRVRYEVLIIDQACPGKIMG